MYQTDLFIHHDKLHVENGWYLKLDRRSTADSQKLVFDVPEAPSNYYRGQQSYWHINAIEESVFYLDGDPDRKPSKEIVRRAAQLLRQATLESRLFPMPLDDLIYECAYSRGYDCGFNNESDSNNPFKPDTKRHSAWVDGWTVGIRF